MSRFFVRHPVTTWMIFTAFVVLALYALPRIEIEAISEIDLPSLTIVTSWNGASPKAIQRSITLPIEEAARRVHGVEKIESESQAGSSRVTAEFRREIDIDFARMDLNEQLGTVRRNLPLNASQPQIQAFVPEEFRTENFFTFSIESTLPPNELREQTERWVLPQVLGVDGVADAQVVGGARPLLKILLDRRKLEFYRITADEVFQAVDALDELTGAGVVRHEGLEKLVALRRDVDPASIERATVAMRGDRSFQLSALGQVVASHEDPQNFVRSNGQTVVSVQVEKRSGGNSVVVSRRLRNAIPQLVAQLPFHASFHVEQDEGRDLEEKLQELLVRSLAILAVLFLLLAISLRQLALTAIVIASIVFALVICLSLFYFLRLSVNFITISGLTICFGMLLDNSILVLDSIHRRLESLERATRAGLSRRAKLRVLVEAVVQGTEEVVFPILATTLTTIVAFLSFIFLSGRLSLYYMPLAISVGLAMLASIFVAFAWIPVVLEQIWARRLVGRSADGPNELTDDDHLDRIVHVLPDLQAPPDAPTRVLGWLQRGWPITVAGLAVLGWLSWRAYDGKVIKGGFWRMPDAEELICYIRLPDGTDVHVTSETFLGFEDALQPIHEGVRVRSNVFGNQAYMQIEFEDPLLRTGIPMLYRALLQEVADQTGGASVFIRGFADTPYVKGNFGGSALNSLVKITGYNSRLLQRLADDTMAKVGRERRVRNARIASSNRFGRSQNEETVITLRRDVLADYGLSVLQVTGQVRRLLGVDTPWRMLIDGDQERVQLAYSDAEQIEFADVATFVLDTPRGEKVRLGDVITMQTVPLSDAITRENQRYTMYVNWEYVGTDKMRQAYIQRIVDSMDLPYGYHAEEATQEFFTEEEETQLAQTLILATAFIFMVLAALFESLWLPLLVMLAVPMSLVGVVWIFAWTATPFDSSARIGLVLLFGVVVNNAILLISRYRHECALVLKARMGGDPESGAGLLRGTRRALGGCDLWLLPAAERAAQLRRAVARGTLVRLRSVLLTTGTTVAGLLPLLVTIEHLPSRLLGRQLPFRVTWLQQGDQDIWENLALSSVGGLVASTVLLLLTMPALYYAVVRLAWFVRGMANRLRGALARRRAGRPLTDAPATAA